MFSPVFRFARSHSDLQFLVFACLSIIEDLTAAQSLVLGASQSVFSPSPLSRDGRSSRSAMSAMSATADIRGGECKSPLLTQSRLFGFMAITFAALQTASHSGGKGGDRIGQCQRPKILEPCEVTVRTTDHSKIRQTGKVMIPCDSKQVENLWFM